jgi:hypothetical protein
MYAKIVFQDPANRLKETEVENTEWKFLEISKGWGIHGTYADGSMGFQCDLSHLVSVNFERPEGE